MAWLTVLLEDTLSTIVAAWKKKGKSQLMKKK